MKIILRIQRTNKIEMKLKITKNMKNMQFSSSSDYDSHSN